MMSEEACEAMRATGWLNEPGTRLPGTGDQPRHGVRGERASVDDGESSNRPGDKHRGHYREVSDD